MADKFPQYDWTNGLATSLLADDGLVAQFMDMEFLDVPQAIGSGLAVVWMGSSWVAKPVKVWSGMSWIEKPIKHWTGSLWSLG